jgi:hypothetical protein
MVPEVVLGEIIFGDYFGIWTAQLRLSISFGDLAMIAYQRDEILNERKWN